ncbi:hypothetical protein AKO1_002283 [Acrasis kona]
MTSLPRQPLSFFEKRDLEKKFAEQVPEFSEYTKAKLNLQSRSYQVPAVAAALTFPYIWRSTFQPITGLVCAGMVFVVGKIGTEFFGKTFGTVGKYNRDECDRAFNLWVYYTQNPSRKSKDLPIHTAKERHQGVFKKWQLAQNN